MTPSPFGALAPVAQLVEHPVDNGVVAGSSPARCTAFVGTVLTNSNKPLVLERKVFLCS